MPSSSSKPWKNIFPQLAGPMLALLLSFIIGGVFILLIGKDPFVVYAMFFSQTMGSWYGIGQVLFKATPLIFTGLSAAISFRAGLFNIGAEGQLIIGSFLVAMVGCTFSSLPSFLLIPCALLAGALGGALWGAIPGFLKAKFGAHEVINTIMMNFVAAGVISYLVTNVYSVPATVHTPQITASAELLRLDVFASAFHGSPVNVSLFIALAACGGVYYLLWRTRFGYELRAIGLNPIAAEYGGISIARRTVLTLALAGALAGLVGGNFVLGYKHYYELGFSEGIGFIGIAVALLARNHPIGIVLASIFFGILEYGSLTINTMVPKELSNILQAIVILFMITLTKFLSRWTTHLQECIVQDSNV
ncbi:MAG: ABC transporter permease [Ignavibacteria bacterium]|nr:ABC transporter permease [Ignavibacteria bacterium]MBI3766399.1 ABC transporter permease [Ignavibacteriales bacterium]